MSLKGNGKGTAAPLRLAILARDSTVLAWQVKAIAAMARDEHVVVSRIIEVAGDRSSGAGRLERVFHRLQHSLESLGARDGSASCDLRREFPGVAIGGPEAGATDDVDLVLDCGFNGASPAIIGRLGTLSCKFSGLPGDLGLYRAMVHDFEPFEISVSLATHDGPRLLDRARPALPERASLRETRRVAYDRAAALLGKAVRAIATGRVHSREGAHPPALRAADTASLYRYAVRRCVTSARGRWASLRRDKFWLDDMNNWFLAYRTSPEHFAANTERFGFDGFRLLLPPPDRYYADPCVFTHRGVDHVFFEDWRHDTGRGVISWMHLDSKGELSHPEVVLHERHHLSYPYVFEAEGHIYMIPESATAKQVSLYRATEFPRRWMKVATLLDGVRAADPTVIRHEGRWWMFLTAGESSRNDQLCLYHAERVHGPWVPHHANPVKIDVTTARPGGRPFMRGGKLLRPGQDCSATYGGAISLNEITELSLDGFSEREIEKVSPHWLPGNVGLHTLSFGSRIEVIDSRIRSDGRRRFPGFNDKGGHWPPPQVSR